MDNLYFKYLDIICNYFFILINCLKKNLCILITCNNFFLYFIF